MSGNKLKEIYPGHALSGFYVFADLCCIQLRLFRLLYGSFSLRFFLSVYGCDKTANRLPFEVAINLQKTFMEGKYE